MSTSKLLKLAQRLESKYLRLEEDPDSIDPDTVDPLYSGIDPMDPYPDDDDYFSDHGVEFAGLHEYIKKNMPKNLSPLEKEKWYKALREKINAVRRERSRPSASHLE